MPFSWCQYDLTSPFPWLSQRCWDVWRSSPLCVSIITYVSEKQMRIPCQQKWTTWKSRDLLHYKTLNLQKNACFIKIHSFYFTEKYMFHQNLFLYCTTYIVRCFQCVLCLHFWLHYATQNICLGLRHINYFH